MMSSFAEARNGIVSGAGQGHQAGHGQEPRGRHSRPAGLCVPNPAPEHGRKDQPRDNAVQSSSVGPC